MKIQKANTRSAKGPNAKDLVKGSNIKKVEPTAKRREKACNHRRRHYHNNGAEREEEEEEKIKKPPRTKENKEKEVREGKRDAFLLFLQEEKNKN